MIIDNANLLNVLCLTNMGLFYFVAGGLFSGFPRCRYAYGCCVVSIPGISCKLSVDVVSSLIIGDGHIYSLVILTHGFGKGPVSIARVWIGINLFHELAENRQGSMRAFAGF
jgi:hypothetical protein